WTTSSETLPDNSLYGGLYEVGGKLYLTGGIVNKIYTADPSDPTIWADTDKTLPTRAEGREFVVVGDMAYLFGGLSSNVIYAANIEALEVYFGESKADIVTLDKENSSLVVSTPTHSPGLVDV